MTINTAILLFTRTAENDSASKPLLGKKNRAHNKTVIRQLIARATAAAKKTPFSFYLIDDRKQIGGSFGERIASSVASVFDKGYEKVMIIGNDCLHLNSTLINDAAAQLQKADFVAGPTNKGGMYLIGITKKHFDKEKFRQIAWQTGLAFQSFIDFAASISDDIKIISTRDDVNNATELLDQLKQLLPFDELKLFLISILSNRFKHFHIFSYKPCCLYLSYSVLRGPPAVKFPIVFN